MSQHIGWSRRAFGYEVSTKGDSRFSAMAARMPDGRTIEMWYQCDIKGYDIGGTNWRLGKGKPPVFPFHPNHMWEMYLSLWRLWAIHHGELIMELKGQVEQRNNMLTDCFASTDINQARALATILNEWII